MICLTSERTGGLICGQFQNLAMIVETRPSHSSCAPRTAQAVVLQPEDVQAHLIALQQIFVSEGLEALGLLAFVAVPFEGKLQDGLAHPIGAPDTVLEGDV